MISIDLLLYNILGHKRGRSKTNNSNIRNIEIIRTYYPGQETPAVKEVAISPKRDKILSIKLWGGIILLFFCILSAGIFIIANYNIPLRTAPEKSSSNKIISLVPAVYQSNIYNYDYGKNRPGHLPITLGPQNTCAFINLGLAMDLTEAAISFKARGEKGNERIAIILRDYQMMSNANKDDIILTPLLFKDNWQNFTITLKNFYMPLDKSRVTQIRFDNSCNLTKNGPAAKVFIKDIVITK